MPFSRKWGSYWVLSPPNRGVVQRTFGLREIAAASSSARDASEGDAARYGPRFRYAEYMVTGTSRVVAALYSATLFAYFAVIFNFAPVRPPFALFPCALGWCLTTWRDSSAGS